MTEPLTPRLAQLLAAIRADPEGIWTPSRARKAYAAAGWDCTDARGAHNMSRLAELGYLTRTTPRSFSYTLSAEDRKP